MTYKKMDMHVHSSFSKEIVPGLNFVFSPQETPDGIYARAKSRGMDFVTITDHDTIDGCLDFLSRHPEPHDFVIGEEVSTQLPRSRLTVHINVYEIDERDHAELQRRRADALEVARYCLDRGIFFVWNHPLYREDASTIDEEEFMTLVDLVPVLEVRNGGRMQILNVLAEELAVSETKAMQGGSDTHTGNIGAVYTAVPCDDVAGFFAGILARESRIVGNHSTKRNFLFHSFLSGFRHMVDMNCRLATGPFTRTRVRALALAALALSPWVVRRHFEGQLQMAKLALASLSSFADLPRTVLDSR